MFSYDLLIPWITLAATLVPLLYVQRWIHRHVFGVGYLLSREKRAATLFYYLFLLPGVILHELSAYLMAGVFNVPSTRFTIYPEAQEDGSLETGFVQLEEVKNPIFAAFIGIAPLLTGMLVVVVISNSLLDLPGFLAQLQTGDMGKIGPAIQVLVNKPDFLLWIYLLFAVANAMMPNAEDRRGWWFVGSASVGLLVFMSILGLGKFVVNWLAGPISSALYSLSAVFGVVLGLDCLAMLGIWIVEGVLERLTGHRIEYQPSKALVAPQAPRKAIRSVYELSLPLPPLPGKITATPAPRLPPATERPAIGSGSLTPERPAIPAMSGQPAASATSASARPALGSGSAERPAPPALPARPAAGSASALAGSRSTGTSPAPFGQSPRPASPSSPDRAEKPGTPFGQPAKPAPASGQPARPGTPFGQPAKPASPSSPDRAEKPGTPFGQPAKPAPASGQPARPGTPLGQPAKPAAPSTPNQAGKPASPFGQPAKPAPASGQPARPGTPFGQPPKPAAASSAGDTEKLGATSPQPAKPGTPFGQSPKSPISGPPALVRPGGPSAPAGSKPPAAGQAKPPFGTSPRPGDSSRSRFGSFDKDSDDVIDADVIDEEEEEEPGFMQGGNKPSNVPQSRAPFGSRPQGKGDSEKKDNPDDEDDNEPKYVDIDDV